jgi:hypothetical protein
MSTQASVHSIDALKDLRAGFALFGEDVLVALGTVDMEIRRTVQWLQQDRPMYWQNQVKRRKEQVAMAKAEVFRRKLAARPGYSPAMSEQKEILAKAEASLRDAELRALQVKKWEPALQLAILEYRGTTRRIKTLATSDVPRAVALIARMVEALEAYLHVTAPSGGGVSPLESFASAIEAEAPSASEAVGDGDEPVSREVLAAPEPPPAGPDSTGGGQSA